MSTHAYRASLVIPLYNRADLTAACLLSLAEHTDPSLYEVVLVDNGSRDGTADLLANLEGDLQVITNAVNRGFAVACNQGARAARGQHLVFVNNDIEAQPGWLEPLLRILDTEPDVAVVGARLLFPDGSLQHGGVVTFVDTETGLDVAAAHFPYRCAADTPPAHQRRDMDVVTGAVMAVRRAAFDAAGGFDEGYWNGNEDVDLCLSVLALGGRVVYEPTSTLIHHESQSGPERFSHVGQNIERLVSRWGARYAPQYIRERDGVLRPNKRRAMLGAFPELGPARLVS